MATDQRPHIPLDKPAFDDMVRAMHRDLLHSLKSIVTAALPSLRVVALTYTGLGGVAALVLVVSVAVMPSQPILQQVTEPARQAVSVFMPPAVELFGRTGVQVPTSPTAAPTAAPFMATVTIDVTISDAEPNVDQPVAEPEPQPQATAVPTPPPPRFFVPAPVEPAPEEAVVEEDQPEDVVDEPAVEVAPTETAIVEPAAPVLRIASAEAPKALPSPPTSPQEAKARADAANQAAIDAAKAAQAEATAEAGAANQAAIDARKRAAAANSGPAMSDAALPLPTPAATSTPAQAAKATANISNQAAIETAKAAQARAKAEADAANQAAIDAAKAAKTKKP